MDFTNFKLAIEAARTVDVPVNGTTFRVRLPTEHDFRIAVESHRDEHGQILHSAALRKILNESLVHWEGVRTVDILPEAADEPLPFSALARGALLDHRQDIADEIGVAVARIMQERAMAREAARKNSARESSSS